MKNLWIQDLTLSGTHQQGPDFLNRRGRSLHRLDGHVKVDAAMRSSRVVVADVGVQHVLESDIRSRTSAN